MALGIYGTLLLAVLLSFLLYVLTWWWTLKKNLPPGPRPLPLLGTMLHVKSSNMPHSLMELSKKYGPVFTIYTSNIPVVVLTGYDCVKEALLLDNEERFGMRGPSDLGDVLFKNCGVILPNGPRWERLHAFIVATLKFYDYGKKSVEARVHEEAHFLTEEMRKRMRTAFDPTHLLDLAVFNVLCSIVFGDRFDYEDVKFKTFYGLLKETNMLMVSLSGMLLSIFPKTLSQICGPHQRIFQNVEKMRAFIAEVVESHNATINLDTSRDFIDTFLIKIEEERHDRKTQFNLDTLYGTIIDFFFAGTETTSITLKYGILYLLKYPYVERKTHMEMDRQIGKGRSPSLEDRVKIPYTDAVIHEIQRFADISPIGLSRAASSDTTFRGYKIPKGTIIFPMLTSVLKDPKWFKNPNNFDPANFLNNNNTFRKNDAFVPFSLGRRRCLGEYIARTEIFIFMTSILKNFKLRSVLDTQEIVLTPQPNRNLSVPKHYQVIVTPR